MSVYVVLVCGGNGTRMGETGNKTLLPVGGVPACIRAARTLLSVADGMIAVVRAGEETLFQDMFTRYGIGVHAVVCGGKSRQQSVRKGLDALPNDCTEVLIHDGARPLVDQKTVRDVLESVLKYGTGIAAMPVADTVKQADADGIVESTLDRSRIWLMQTPQGFRRELLMKAHLEAKDDMTDDAGLVEALGEKVHLVKSRPNNIKLTTQEDWAMAELLAGASCRIGSGFDAHRLVLGRDLVLCGVKIHYEFGLDGHSDADVALHALCDALLGAAALGDIGRHFPDTDEKYRGISSLILTESTREILEKAGYRPGNVDITIVAQKPKLAPYIEEMRVNVSRALRIPVEDVSVKATTTEKMGYEGRGEGISAQASVIILRNQRNLL